MHLFSLAEWYCVERLDDPMDDQYPWALTEEVILTPLILQSKEILG